MNIISIKNIETAMFLIFKYICGLMLTFIFLIGIICLLATDTTEQRIANIDTIPVNSISQIPLNTPYIIPVNYSKWDNIQDGDTINITIRHYPIYGLNKVVNVEKCQNA